MKVRCEVQSVYGDNTPVIITNDENDSFRSRVCIEIGDKKIKVRGKELIAAITCCLENY